MNLKKLLKAIKLNESRISMILGVVVVILAGVLIFNYFKKTRVGTTYPTSITTQSLPGSVETNSEGRKVYTVAKGDNLWKIAEVNLGSGYKWAELAKENNLTNPGSIEEGQKLTLPESEPQAAITPTLTTQSPNTITGNTYTVVKGDCLWDIAVRAYGDGYKWVELAKENKLAHPNLIHSGNVLTLPR